MLPTEHDVHVNQIMSNISVLYKNTEFIADKVLVTGLTEKTEKWFGENK